MQNQPNQIPGTSEQTRQPFSLLGTDWDYWFDRETWSSLMGFLLLTSAILIVALPNSIEIGSLTPRSFEFADLFTAIYVILFGVLAITQGQAEVSWNHRLSSRSQFVHLLSRQLLAIGLSLPFWIFYIFANIMSPWLTLAVVAHFALYGFVLGLFGWRLSLTHKTEIFQFNLKYLTFIGFLVVTYLAPPLRFLNPVWVLTEMLNPTTSDALTGIWVFYGAWAALGGGLVFWVLRKLRDEKQELEEYEDELSRDRA